MRYVSPSLVMMAALMLSAPAVHADPMTFFATLSGANENPPNASPGTGLATIVLDPTAQTLTVSATFSGLTSNDINDIKPSIAVKRCPALTRTSASPPQCLRFPGSL